MARGRLPRQPSAVPGHARHARQRHRGHRAAEGRPADRPRRPLRRPGHRQGLGVRARTPRSSTSTSTRPSRARCAVPTSPSWATAGSSSRSSSGRSATCWTAAPTQADTGAWRRRISGWREQYPLTYEQSQPGEALKPQYCLEMLRDSAPTARSWSRAWASTRCGQPVLALRRALHVGELGRAGHDGLLVPAAIGAKVGRPDRTVWAVDGDGCFQMTAQELVTASTERIPIKVAILNNAYLGMVRQWQEMFYDERYSEVYLSPDLPDYVGWAEAMGCVGIRVESPEEVQPAIDKANDDRRPAGGGRLPHRRRGEGVPDGARRARPTTTSCCRRRRPAGRRRCDDRDAAEPSAATTSCPCWSRTAPACSPGWRRCSPAGATTSSSLAVAPTEDERFSRITIVVDVESRPLEQITKQLFKLIDVVKISELDPRDSVERELLLATVRADARRAQPGRRPRARSSRARSSPSGPTPSPCRWRATRPSSTTSRSCCGATASSSCSAPAGSRCRSSIVRHASAP